MHSSSILPLKEVFKLIRKTIVCDHTKFSLRNKKKKKSNIVLASLRNIFL